MQNPLEFLKDTFFNEFETTMTGDRIAIGLLVSFFLSQVYKERLCLVFLCRRLPDCYKRGQGPVLIPLLTHVRHSVRVWIGSASPGWRSYTRCRP